MLDIKKLRPKNLEDVIGNTYTVELLTKALQNNNFPSFTILAGPAGIGKTTLSKIFAKHLTCENSQNGFACEECSSCKNANKLVIEENKDSVNILTFRMSDEGGKRPARKIQEQIQSMPQFSKYKVIILEEVQGISREAQDLLLPILEYIPDDTKIIACTTDLKFLQKTFISRAHVLKMVTPSKELIENLLTKICNENGIQIIGKLPITRIVENCEFKPRHSINELIKLSKYSDIIDIKVVSKFLDLVNEEYYLEYLELLRGDMGGIIDFTNKLQSKEVPIRDFTKGLNEFMIKLITFRYRTITLPESILNRSKKLLNGFDENQLLKVQSIIADEVPKFTEDEYSRSQLISLSFKLMNKDNSALLENAIKSDIQVRKEKELALKNQIEYNRQKETQNQINSISNEDTQELLLLNTDAKVIRFGPTINPNPQTKDLSEPNVSNGVSGNEEAKQIPQNQIESQQTNIISNGINKPQSEDNIEQQEVNTNTIAPEVKGTGTPNRALEVLEFLTGNEFSEFNLGFGNSSKEEDGIEIELNL